MLRLWGARRPLIRTQRSDPAACDPLAGVPSLAGFNYIGGPFSALTSGNCDSRINNDGRNERNPGTGRASGGELRTVYALLLNVMSARFAPLADQVA